MVGSISYEGIRRFLPEQVDGIRSYLFLFCYLPWQSTSGTTGTLIDT